MTLDGPVSAATPLRTLVVGGGGFIGSHLVRELVSSGRTVTVLGRSVSPRFTLPAAARYVQGSAGNVECIKPLLHHSDELLDLAYASIPKTSFINPVADILDNLPSTVSLLNTASTFPLKKVLLVSSGGTVYGEADHLPIGESHPLRPISPYGISKLAIENYARLFHKLNNLPVVIARPSNPYGPGQKGSEQGFIGAAFRSAIAREDVTIFGARGTLRDYIYISDLISGLVALLTDGRPGETYNIGTGIGTDNAGVLDVMDKIVAQDGYVISRRYFPERNFDVATNILDSSKLKSETGWEPQVSLADGLKKTYEAWRKT